MRNFIIVTDTGADLGEEYYTKNDVRKLKLGYNIDGVDYEGEEGEHLEEKAFYDKLKTGAMPKTSQINPGIAKKHFEELIKEGKDILVISFSSGLSGTYNSYCIAAEEINSEYNNKVLVVDSLCASLGQGLFVDYIVRYSDLGTSIEETKKYAEDLKLKIRHEFTVEDLFHLKRGGRVSAVSAVVGSLFSIKPILNVNEEGKLIPIDKVRGRKNSLKTLAEIFRTHNDVNDNDPVFISHADSLEDALFLKEKILEIKPNVEIYINYIGPVIGSHAGQGTIALFYKGKDRSI